MIFCIKKADQENTWSALYNYKKTDGITVGFEIISRCCKEVKQPDEHA